MSDANIETTETYGDAIEGRLRRVLGNVLGDRTLASGLAPGHALVSVLDSLKLVGLLVEIESEFGIIIPDDRITASAVESITTLAALVQDVRDTEPRACVTSTSA